MEQVFSVAGKLSKVIKNMQKCLQCTICLQIISDPVKTHCGHRFCRICIQPVIQNKNALCPLCNCAIQRRSISKDENTAIYIKKLQNIIDAIQLDSGIDIVTHLSELNTCEAWSNNTESNTEVKPSCSYSNETRQRIQPIDNNANGRRKRVRKKSQKTVQRKKIVGQESNSMTRYLSRCELSGIEPLEASNDYSGEKSLENKVCSWLDTLPGNENLLDPNPATKVEHDLDDTLTMSVSENDEQGKRIDTQEDVKHPFQPMCSDTDRSTIKETPRESCSSRNNEGDKKGLDEKSSKRKMGDYSSRMDFDASKAVKSCDDGKDEEKFIEVQRTSPCDMLPSMHKNWSSVAKFGKEMRAKRKRLKSLDVSIENRGKRRSMDEANEVDKEKVELLVIGETSNGRRGSNGKCEKSNVDRTIVDEEFLEKSSIATRYDGVEAEVESSSQVQVRDLNTCRTLNAIVLDAESDENRRVEGSREADNEERQIVFNTPVHDRSKIFSQMTPEGLSKDDQDRANLVDESDEKRSLPAPTKGNAAAVDEPCRSTPKFQISTPVGRKRLSLKRQDEDSKSSNTSNTNVDSRLNAVRRDLNRQIEEENADTGNVDGINGRGKRIGDERVKNITSNDRRRDKQRNASLVTFKKLGKIYKRDNEGRVKRAVSFFYLGGTGKEMSYYPGLHTHKSCNLVATCNVEEKEVKSGSSIVSIADRCGSNVENIEGKVDDRTVSENQEEDALRRISKEVTARPTTSNANKSYDVDVLLVSSDDEPSTPQPPIPNSGSSCKDTVKISSSSKDCSLVRFLSVSPPIDTLQTQKLNEDERTEPKPAKKRKSNLVKVNKQRSFACISPQCGSSCALFEKKKGSSGSRRTEHFHEAEKESSGNGGEEDDSNHSVSSQTTCIRSTIAEVKNSSRKINSNEKNRSSNPSSKDTEVIQNLNRDVVKIYTEKIREKVYNRIVLIDSSESESTDLACLDNNDNDRPDASPKIKRKRTISLDSADETDLNAIVSNWCNDGKLDERCKKKGKLERDILDTPSTSRDNLSTKSLDLVVGKFGKEKSNFSTGTNWTRKLEDRMALVVDEDSPDFCAVIDKVQNVRNGTMEKQEKTAENLMHDNFDDVIANVNTADLMADFGDGKEDKFRRECMEEKNDCERKSKHAKSCSEKIRSWNNEILHNKCSNGSDKENRNRMDVSDGDDNENPVCVNVSNKSWRKDRFQEKMRVESCSKELTKTLIENLMTSSDKRFQMNNSANSSMVKDMHDYDSLMAITQDDLMIKQFEEDLFGKPSKHSNDTLNKEQRTPKSLKKNKKCLRENEKNIQDVEHSGEEDDIVENTPKAKRKKLEAIINSPRESLSSISKTVEKSAYVRTPSSIMTTGSNLASTPSSTTNIQPLHQSTPKMEQFKNISVGIAKRISVMNEQTKNTVQRIGSQKSATQRSISVQNISQRSIEQRINIQRSDFQNTIQRSDDQRNSDQEINVQNPSQRNNDQRGIDQRSIVQNEIVQRNNISSQRTIVRNTVTQKLCFVCSGLVSSDIEQVKTLAQKVNAKYRMQFDHEVTHVIVKTDKDNSANKTLKYLQGVAHKKWIVSFDWVINSLKENRLVNEEPYEVVDSRTLEAGPRRSRLREKDLFTGFVFFCNGPYDNVSVQQYQDMLRATGAIVVQSLSALAAEKSRLRIIMIQADMYEYEIIKWYKMVHAVSIVHEWVVECISQYKLISFYPYLQELSREDVLVLGYPEYLLEEEVDEDSDNSCDVSM